MGLQVRRHLAAHLLLFLTVFAVTSCSYGSAPGALSGAQMAQADRLYDASRFSDAVVQYEALVESGAKDGRLYYNLANAYFKSGDLGRAVLNYHRAQRLLPRDGDVAANLELARARTLDSLEAQYEGAVIGSVRQLVGWTTLREAAIVALFLWAAIGGLIVSAILWQDRRRLLFVLAGVAAVLLVLILVSVGVRIWDERDQPPAVIVVAEASVHSGPSADYLTEFLLHAGTEVRIVERRAEWTRIALPGDLQGWVPTESAVPIAP